MNIMIKNLKMKCYIKKIIIVIVAIEQIIIVLYVMHQKILFKLNINYNSIII